MGMVWTSRQTQYGTPYKWEEYVSKVLSIIISRHSDADRIICVNDPYDSLYSTTDDERDLRLQYNAHCSQYLVHEIRRPFSICISI